MKLFKKEAMNKLIENRLIEIKGKISKCLSKINDKFEMRVWWNNREIIDRLIIES